MSKTKKVYLNFRIEEEIKNNFLKICEEVKTPPASILREMVKIFIDEHNCCYPHESNSNIELKDTVILQREIKSLKKKINSLKRRLYRKSKKSIQ